MQKSELQIFLDIGELLSLDGAVRKIGRHCDESDLSIIRDAVVVCEQGQVSWIGTRKQWESAQTEFGSQKRIEHSLGGRTVIPGFVECHTHSVFAGQRAEEFEWRVQGQTYLEISKKGGGILSTVRATRDASYEELLNLTQQRANRFLSQGVTTLEIKSGYGLDLHTEMKCLKVARALRGPHIVTTYLGPHSKSPDFSSLDEYLEFIVETALPQIVQENLADRADIYIENGFFSVEQGRRYFEAAKRLGLKLTAHVEQLSLYGGTDLALELACESVDHIVFINPSTQAKLAKSSSVGVLLPMADFYLDMAYPPARELLDQGACVALSTDFNPGTSPSQDIDFTGLLARIKMKMTQAEVLVALTLGGAKALGLQDSRGALCAGYRCDFSVLRGSWRDLFYSIGQNSIAQVFIGGVEQKISQ